MVLLNGVWARPGKPGGDAHASDAWMLLLLLLLRVHTTDGCIEQVL